MTKTEATQRCRQMVADGVALLGSDDALVLNYVQQQMLCETEVFEALKDTPQLKEFIAEGIRKSQQQS